MEKNYLMVRAMNSTPSDFEIFFNNNVVAVGWSEVNFTQFDLSRQEELIKEVNDCYYSSPDFFRPLAGKKLNEVRRFNNINEGDYILIPYYSSIRLAIAEKETQYSNEAYDADLSNQRKVRYVFTDNTYKTVPRDVLSEALQRRLRVRGSTVSDLYEFKDEIEKLFSSNTYTWSSGFQEKENLLRENFKMTLITNIRDGNTNLKTGGIGLENLVQELLEIEGYSSQVLAKTAFINGDADVYASKTDKFQETKLLVQVKHHSGFTDEWGLHQLRDIKQNGEYKDYKFVLLTSANLTEDFREKAENIGITAIDGLELAEWIIENIDKIKPETKIRLGISSIPQVN